MRRKCGRANARSACRKKTQAGNVFSNRAGAEIVARKMSRQTGSPIGAFRCHVCGLHHVGKQALFHHKGTSGQG